MVEKKTQPDIPKQDEDPKKPKKKIIRSFEDFKEGFKKEEFLDYAKTNTRDIIAYVAMIIGLILLFFLPLIGQLIIGFVFGIYFTREIVLLVRDFNAFVDKHGMVKSLVFAGTALGFFICVPWIFIGIAIAVGVKYLVVTELD